MRSGATAVYVPRYNNVRGARGTNGTILYQYGTYARRRRRRPNNVHTGRPDRHTERADPPTAGALPAMTPSPCRRAAFARSRIPCPRARAPRERSHAHVYEANARGDRFAHAPSAVPVHAHQRATRKIANTYDGRRRLPPRPRIIAAVYDDYAMRARSRPRSLGRVRRDRRPHSVAPRRPAGVRTRRPRTHTHDDAASCETD